MSKKALALKLLTNSKVRQGAFEYLKDPRMDKKALAFKIASNPKMREAVFELLKDAEVRSLLLQRAAGRFRRS